MQLKKVRKLKNLTAAQLAGKVNVSEKTIKAIENKTLPCSVSLAQKIAKELNSTIDYLFMGD